MNIVKHSFTVQITCGILLLALFSSGDAQTRADARPHAGPPKVGRSPIVNIATERRVSPDVRSLREFDALGEGSLDFSSATVFEVTNTQNSGNGSLTDAILSANANAGPDIITFNIPGSGVQTIRPLSSLAAITGPVVIDGTTQPGYSGMPLIELDGSLAGVGADGLTILGGNSVVRGLVINSFAGTGPPGYSGGLGIDFGVNGGNRVEGCYIGTDATGMIARNNAGGIGIFGGSGSNIIGGTTPSTWNVLSGNLFSGVQISTGTTGRNVVQGNLIGVNAAGTGPLGNGGNGVQITGSTFPDTIGGTAAGGRNIISGNGFQGIYIGPSVAGTVIQGNYIGTDVTGSVRIPNMYEGIVLRGPRSIIGGPTVDARNVISGNDGVGIYILDSTATGNRIQGNYIGTSAAGTGSLGNSYGIAIDNALNNTIGEATPGGGNLVSGNDFTGIYIGPSAAGNVIQGNYIGTDVTGSVRIPNVYEGIQLRGPRNTVGGTTVDARNVVSGNDGVGIYIYDSAANGNAIQGNFIGTSAAGTDTLGNSWGIVIENATNTTIGGTSTGERNIISGNASLGIDILKSGAGANKVLGNYIGTDIAGTGDLGNGSYGVMIASSQDTIGGTSAGAGNVIAYNHGAGVYHLSGTGTLIRMNSIFSNYGGLGIDLSPRGLARNDSLDGDLGPNNFQNFPLLDSAAVAEGNTTIHGRFNSLAPSDIHYRFLLECEVRFIAFWRRGNLYWVHNSDNRRRWQCTYQCGLADSRAPGSLHNGSVDRRSNGKYLRVLAGTVPQRQRCRWDNGFLGNRGLGHRCEW